MATAGFKTRVLLGDFSLSPKLHTISLPRSVEMHEVTTLADDGVKRFIPGLESSTASMSGFLDIETAADSAAWTTATPLTYAPNGLSRGTAVQLVDALRASYEVGTPVGSAVSFDLSAQTDGFTDFGVSLKDLAAVTSDTNETSHDNSASTASGGVGHLHVTAFSGFTSVVFKIQHSTDNSSWNDLVTFTTATAVTGERIAVSGTVNRYLRATADVTGTGSVTYQASFARRTPVV